MSDTPLTPLLGRLMQAHGPIAVADYMALCLAHPDHGYYQHRDPLGVRGDFTTAPEISQIFGELLGLWAADLWQRSSAPTPFAWVELGPGRGTLSADALRATQRLPGFADSLSVHLVETSPALRQEQRQRLPHAQHHDSIDTLPTDRPLLILANEFFDALPTRQLVMTPNGWRERLIGRQPEGGFHFTADLHSAPQDALVPPALRAAAVGTIFELNTPGLALARTLAQRLHTQGGALLVLDYGHSVSGHGDTLQALSRHAYTDPLTHPGDCDLTTHVDFAALADALTPLTRHGPVTQGQFLAGLGIEQRLARLTAANPDHAADLRQGVQRLTAPDQMGQLFKVLAATAPGWPTPAGF